MSRFGRLRALVVTVGLAFGFGGCGSGSELPAPTGETPADQEGEEPAGIDRAALWADLGCGGCHGEDGTGGFGPALTCFAADGFVAYLVPDSTPHTAGARSDLTDEQALALAEFLDGGACTDHVPASHTVPQGTAGVLHHPDFATPDTSCTPCHGLRLEGYGTIPSCASCHGGGTGLTGCTSCHDEVNDELALAHLHGPAKPTDADCKVCHDTSQHRQGAVRLFDVDDPTTVIVLTGDPATDADEAAKLEPFCLACHDADAANGSAPFSDGVTPPVVDETAWSASAHAGADLTCSGDGDTFGCHTAAHGSAYDALLHAKYVVADPHPRTDGDYQACWACHSKSTILTGQNAFGERHKKHVAEEHTACAACHGVHGSYDASERGLISFARALGQGWLTLPSGTTLSSAFVASSGGGTCSLRCHTETHSAEGYTGR